MADQILDTQSTAVEAIILGMATPVCFLSRPHDGAAAVAGLRRRGR